MSTITHASTISASASRKQRTYSAEFKTSIVQACKDPTHPSPQTALQHGLNANLVCRWIRLLDGEQARHHPSPHLLHCLTLQQSIHPLQQCYPFTLLCLIRT